MGPSSFIMVLIGCAQGQQCAPIATLPVAYRNEALCLAARGDIVAASSDLSDDRVFAGHDAIDHALLHAAEGRESEGGTEDRERIGHSVS